MKTPSSRPNAYHLSTDQLYPLIILAGYAIFVSLVALSPNDFWWHLKIGEIIYTTRSIPGSNLFAWTLAPDAPFTYGAWLGELFLYVVYRFGGLEMASFARTLCLILAFWLTAYHTRLQSKSWRLAALALALLCLMTVNNLVVRPQIWAWLPFAGFLLVLSSFAAGQTRARWLVLCPLSMAFWVNVHGSFILGGALVGIYFVGEGVQTLLKPAAERAWNKTGAFFATGMLSGLAMLTNPKGFGIVGYVLDLLTDQPSQKLIEEWQTPSPTGIANTVFYASILLFIAALAYSRYRLSPTELLLAGSFMWLAWSGQRYVIWYGMVVMPIWAKLLSELPMRIPLIKAQKNWLNNLLALFLFIPAVFVQPWFVENLPLSAEYWQRVHKGAEQGPLISVENPLAAAAYLKAHPGGKLFNEMGYGSYLIWAVPEQGVFIDPRVELYPYEQWEDYLRISRGALYNQMLEKYHANRILLNRDQQPGLASALVDDPLWVKEYEDAYSQVWRKK